MTDATNDRDAADVNADHADRDALHAVARGVADNAQDVDALEEQVMTVMAAVADLLEHRRSELKARADRGHDEPADSLDDDREQNADADGGTSRGFY